MISLKEAAAAMLQLRNEGCIPGLVNTGFKTLPGYSFCSEMDLDAMNTSGNQNRMEL